MSSPSGWYSRSFQGHFFFTLPSPLTCSLPSSIASCSVEYLALLAEPYLHFSALVPWPKASLLSPLPPPLPLPHPSPSPAAPTPPPPPPPPSPPPTAFALLQFGQGQCSKPAGCEHGGESWQEPEWITDDLWPAGGRRGIPAFFKRNTYPVATAGVGF